MRTSTGLATIFALALAAAAGAQGGGAAPAEPGRAIEGRLNRAEVRHPLTLRAGQVVRITARSKAFDPMLKLYGPTGTEPLATDDDSGGGTVAELSFTAERAGTYQIGVSVSGDANEDDAPAAPAGRGRSYDLTVLAATAPSYAPPRPLVVNGAPVPVDMGQCGDGCRFTFTANAGDRLVAETSDDDAAADPVLALYRGDEKLAEDDDGGEGVNARLVRPLDRAGTYTLLAKTLNGGGTYKLAVSVRAHVSRPPLAVGIGLPAMGAISPESEINDEGRFYNSYTLHGRAGQRVALDMSSTDFDTVIDVVGTTVIGTVKLATNDDADAAPGGRGRPSNTNSHLVVTFARDGDVEVRAVSLDKPTGAYTLRVSEAAR